MRTMKFLRYFVVAFALVGVCSGELPSYYKTVNRVVWVVKNIDHAKQGWIGLGLSDVHEYPDTRLTGQYHGRPTTITHGGLQDV